MNKNLCIKLLRTISPGKIRVLAFGLAMTAFHLAAVPVTVQEVGVGPHEIVEMTSSTLGTAWVYAGPLDLVVNGEATQGFCIDPWHWSVTGPQAYNTETLGDGPKAPGGAMGSAKALKIEQLWAQYYSADMSNQTGAGLQIAIWELVGGSDFRLDSSSDYGAADMLGWVDSHPDAIGADLLAVTGPGQDYTIPRNSVPDGGATAVLLASGLLGLAALRSRFLARSAAWVS